MSPPWEALVARAHGLSTHLLSSERVQAVERAADTTELMLAVQNTPYADHFHSGVASPGALELAVTSSLADRMAILARWAGPGGSALEPLFIEQDARNVRDVLRGLAGALPPDERLASVIPTPRLGWKRLTVLARLASPAEIAAKLVAWDHPLGSALQEEAGASRADLFRLETALARGAASAATRAARKCGPTMREFVRESIDARNAVTAILLVGARAESESAELFVEGGASLRRDELVRAASAADRATAAERLAAASGGTTLAGALAEAPAKPARLSDRILAARIAAYETRALEEPLGAVPVLLFVLRLRREARALRRAAWTVTLAGGRRA